MVETIIDLLAKQFRIDPATIDADTNIVEELGAEQEQRRDPEHHRPIARARHREDR